MDDSLSWKIRAESFLALRGVTDVFFQLTAQTSDRVGLGHRACDGNPVTVGAGGLHDLRDQLEANTVENTAKVSASVVIAKTRKPGLHEEDPGAGGRGSTLGLSFTTRVSRLSGSTDGTSGTGLKKQST